MTHALSQVTGAVTCLFATSFGRPLYERLGFRAADRSARFIGPLTPGPAGGAGLAGGGRAGRGRAAGRGEVGAARR